MLNQRIGEKRVPKKSQLSASHPALLEPFEGITCNGRLDHAETWGAASSSKNLHLTQNWTGICEHGSSRQSQPTQKALRKSQTLGYPAASAQADEAMIRLTLGVEGWCPACATIAGKFRRDHTRTGDCKYPDVLEEEFKPVWKCAACARIPPRPRSHYPWES